MPGDAVSERRVAGHCAANHVRPDEALSSPASNRKLVLDGLHGFEIANRLATFAALIPSSGARDVLKCNNFILCCSL